MSPARKSKGKSVSESFFIKRGKDGLAAGVHNGWVTHKEVITTCNNNTSQSGLLGSVSYENKNRHVCSLGTLP